MINWKKWFIRFGFGFLIYMMSVQFLARGTILLRFNILFLLVGILIFGAFALWLSERIFESDIWTCAEEGGD